MGEKKSLEELRAEAKRLRDLKADKDERATLETEVKELRNATGQVSLKRKALHLTVKGMKGVGKGIEIVGKQVQADLDGSWQEKEKQKKAQKKAQEK
jgi:hypothetical protein